MTAKERAKILYKLADLVEKNIDELAQTDTMDMGKPIMQSRSKDIPRTVDNFRFFADYIKAWYLNLFLYLHLNILFMT